MELLLGTYKVRGHELIYNTLQQALASGYRSFDTAAVYRNEGDIGTALQQLLPQFGLQRGDVFITSKLGPKDQGAGKCREACLKSLSQLQTDYLDLYLIHWPGVQKVQPGDARNREMRQESWRDMEQLHKEGKLRSLGVSNYTGKHLEELLQHCRVKPAVLQVEHHPHLIQRELVELCRAHDIHFQAYSSLGTSADNNKLLHDPVVKSIAEKLSKSPAQILLRWAVQQGIGVIPKSTNPQHIQDNARLEDFSLEDCDMERLNGLNCDRHYCWNPDKIL